MITVAAVCNPRNRAMHGIAIIAIADLIRNHVRRLSQYDQGQRRGSWGQGQSDLPKLFQVETDNIISGRDYSVPLPPDNYFHFH